MELRVIRYFLAIAREQGITRAAEVLHITQPTLSRQIAEMEDELGVKLFNREGRRIRLTEEGILFRRRAMEIMRLVDKTKEEMREQDEIIEGTVSIGSGILGSVRVLVDMIGHFRERYPNVRFDIDTGIADLVTDRMDQGILDMGILLEPVDAEKYEYVRFPRREHWVAVMTPDSPLAEKEFITADDLKHEELILPIRLKVQGELATWFGRSFSQLSSHYRSNISTNALYLVHRHLGIALTVSGSQPFIDSNQIVVRPLQPELSAGVLLAWKREVPRSRAVSVFIDFVREALTLKSSAV